MRLDIAPLLAAWPIACYKEISLLQGGTNNGVWLIQTEDNNAYVLRLMPAQRNLERLHFEDRLLSALNALNLPFALPVLLRTRDGNAILRIEDAQLFVTLTPRLSGETIAYPPERHDLALTRQAGRTLALLDEALASLPGLDVPGQEMTNFGDLSHCHVLVPDPLAGVEKLPIAREEMRQLQASLDHIMECVGNLYAQLPQQLLHRDYDPGNILAHNGQITAVLDFEFAGVDLRVLDLCVALSWWPAQVMGTGQEWTIIDALGAAYVEHIPLSVAELQAIPDVLRLRDATSLVHRMGRYFAGLEMDSRMRERVQHTFWREEWLSANREQLLDYAMSWRAKR